MIRHWKTARWLARKHSRSASNSWYEKNLANCWMSAKVRGERFVRRIREWRKLLAVIWNDLALTKPTRTGSSAKCARLSGLSSSAS